MSIGSSSASGGNATIQDVAALAKVSTSTVSNFLNGRDERMGASTRRRVIAAIEELGYQPNSAARQLRTGKGKTIGLIVPSVANPFWGGFAKAVESQTPRYDQHVLLCNAERDPEREQAFVEEMWADGVRSVIIGSSLPTLEHLRPAMDRGMRLVAFDREPQAGDPSRLITVSVDNLRGGYIATEHLISLGHRRIGFISGPLATVSRRQRLAGYSEALTQADVAIRDDYIWTSGPSTGLGDLDGVEHGRQAMRGLLALPEPPTAVVAINDLMAIGACAAIRECGMSVPDDVSVVGFDDIMLASVYNPPLTTVRQPLERMAHHVVEALQSDPQEMTTAVLLGPSLVVRESTKEIQE